MPAILRRYCRPNGERVEIIWTVFAPTRALVERHVDALRRDGRRVVKGREMQTLKTKAIEQADRWMKADGVALTPGGVAYPIRQTGIAPDAQTAVNPSPTIASDQTPASRAARAPETTRGRVLAEFPATGTMVIWDDGGREAAGFVGRAGDCVVRSIAIATGEPYAEVYSALADAQGKSRLVKHRKRSARNGVRRVIYEKYLAARGWQFVATMAIGSGCRVHLRADELPAGRLIVRASRHLTAMVDGVIRDTYDPSRDGTRCVYGYYMRKL